ncbi:type II toxin-antitoxin system CcdA family antitoxin [Pseudomonas sp. 25 E 4]|uniref:type II toxin-antitoxin system CcdA family antitoxin n=1 Tax=Pseudomonas sp. 25 E 4 TaxID=1844097 RepID=UPI000812682A|nr:type II toxin-antitoxin system CcdA family antitoxin [Pseudomonas sp. 25 E 4]CRM69872.1 putative toxin-antitoxin system antitoxin component [Pseudomonas sp. 25 E 4]
MPLGYDPNAPKQALNLFVNGDLLDRAVELDLNLSAVLENAIAEAVVRSHESEQSLEENQDAILDESVDQIDPNVLTAAIGVFGNATHAKKWLTTPSRALGNKRPAEADTEEVMDLIRRIDNGFGA